jgi:hypothetical protein
MEFTGNPFVDGGLAVVTHLADKSDIRELSLGDISSVLRDGSALCKTNASLKSFTMVFGTNGPLTQYAYRKSGANEIIYKGVLRRLAEATSDEGLVGEPCELTGIPTKFDLHKTCSEALIEGGQKTPERKWVGRDWVPLAGSLGNDAQALPAASRPLHVSARALLALQFLPQGLFLFQGRLACYQSTYSPLMQELTASQVDYYRNQLAAGNHEIRGKGEGSASALRLLLEVFGALQKSRSEAQLPPHTDLYLWLFSNSGASADCRIVEIPDRVLRFLWECVEEDLSGEIDTLVRNEPKDSRRQFMTAIREGKDFRGLYPLKKWPGASQRFFEFYQRKVCGWKSESLRVARYLAGLAVKKVNANYLRDLAKPETRNAVRKLIADTLTVKEYDALFPSTRHPVRSEVRGWDLLRYYISRERVENTVLPEEYPMTTTHPKVLAIADEYFRTRSTKRIKSVLERMARRDVGLRWLQDVFCEMAEKHPDFELGDWDEFVCDEQGRPIPYELLFQIRLRLANLYRDSSLVTQEVK